MKKSVYLGIDWGGTYIKAGVVNDKGVVIRKEVFSSQQLKQKDIFIEKICSLIHSFNDFKIKAIGIGAPGIIDIQKGYLYYLPNVAGWDKYPLRDVLRKKLKLPVFLDNDANLFALAETRLGAAKGSSRVLFLTLGTGVGGAVISKGKILEGKTSASELGHVAIEVNGLKCGCGGRGCIETFVGNRYLVKRYKELTGNKISSIEVKDIYLRALRGEKTALFVWREFSHALGKFLAGMINIFNPQAIVFGGGVSGAFNIFKPLVIKAIKDQAMWPNVVGLKLVRARLKDAGIIGAAIFAKESLEGKYKR